MHTSPRGEEIEIFPNRILGAKTVEKLLNEIADIKGIEGVLLQGLRVKTDVKDKIVVKDSEMELSLAVGRLIIGVKNIDAVIDKLKDICDRNLPFGYSIRIGKFTKDYPTLHDFKVLDLRLMREIWEDEE